MIVKFVTRVFLPNKDFVVEARAPRYDVTLLPTGWVRVQDMLDGRLSEFPPHMVSCVEFEAPADFTPKYQRRGVAPSQGNPLLGFDASVKSDVPTKRGRGRPPAVRKDKG